MGCGEKGTFDSNPDFQQWAIFSCNLKSTKYPNGKFVRKWLKFFRCEEFVINMEPREGYGKWDGIEVFPGLTKMPMEEGLVAVLTRATVRLKKLGYFQKSIKPVAELVKSAEGLLYTLGIGEIPFIKQATFSIWKDINVMKNFAYQSNEHRKVIKLTSEQQWYSEQMFIRFRIISFHGSIKGHNPLANM